MHIRAESDPRYYRRFLIMGFCALGFALWCLKDGLQSYPAKRERGFAEFKEDYKSHFKDERGKRLDVEQFEVVADDQLRDEWEHYIHDRDIPSAPAILTQFIMAGVSTATGLFLLSMPLRARGRWIASDETGLASSWGEGFRYDEIEEVDKSKWRKKGIAKVTYVANSRRSTFLVDDYKYDRYRTDAILYLLEQRIDPGRITNGPPEPEPEDSSEVGQALKNPAKSAG
jgi:hypothetical protein